MIYEVVLPWLHATRRAKVDPVCFANALDLFVVARQANEVGVEFGQVLLEHLGVVARGVACDHYGKEDVAAFRDDFVVHEGHFVEFVGANVRAVGEAKVDLQIWLLQLFNAPPQGSRRTSEYLPSMSSLLNTLPF